MTKFLKVAVCLLLAALIGADVVAAPYPECNPGECPPNQSVTPAMSFTVTVAGYAYTYVYAPALALRDWVVSWWGDTPTMH